MDVTFSDGTTESYEDTPFTAGAQGAIYLSRDKQHVFKLYKGLTPAEQDEREKQVDLIIGTLNVINGDPYWDELYAWPEKRAISPGLGVRMRNISGLTRMDHFFYRKAYQRLGDVQRGWWIGRVAAAIKLARAMNRLSNKGLCHSDLSDRNLMVDAFAGRLTVLDCDSLVVPNLLPPSVRGTPGYMAPELFSYRVSVPSVETDRHAMAVLLYRWLLYRHPLLGPKQHDPNDPDRDEALMLGDKALYIEHPTDRSNRPDTMPITADALTPRLRDLFRQAFIDGLHTPTKRPLPVFWEEALIEMFDRIVPCSNPDCEWRFFVAQEGKPLRCPVCKTYLDFKEQIPFLKLRTPVNDRGTIVHRDEGGYSRYIAAWPERPVYGWHADPAIKPVPDIVSGLPPDTKPRAIIRFDAHDREWYLDNAGLPEMAVGVGPSSSIAWQPVPLGSRTPLRPGFQLLLGPHDTSRVAFVEMRSVR